MHGLDPTQGSILPNTSFNLPPLQGTDISEHFHRIGAHAAQPWLNLAKIFTSSQLPPKPEDWHIQAGWTKYYHLPDGSSYCEHVDRPEHNGKLEEMLCFDVETMPNLHPYPVLACAVSPNAWYIWISPWLLGQTEDPQCLVPMGSGASTSQIIVGHNVSYDRIRIEEEYNAHENRTRFLDTMSLHVAVSGISSHQRPSWTKYRKEKRDEEQRKEEAVQAIVNLINNVKRTQQSEVEPERLAELSRIREEMEESLQRMKGQPDQGALDDVDSNGEDVQAKRWEDITAANSLADVAKLHCGIVLDKQIRNDFLNCEKDYIVDNICDYIDYCASDVEVTHRVYSVVFPAFLEACPHPVSFAGMLTMGSSFLTVDENWERYLKQSDAVWQSLESEVMLKLKKLAEEAKNLSPEDIANDPWLSQLDWTPKVAGKSRGIDVPEVTEVQIPDEFNLDSTIKPTWYLQVSTDPFSKTSLDRILPVLLQMSYDGYPLIFNTRAGWHYVANGCLNPLSLTKGKKTGRIFTKSLVKHLKTSAITSPHLETVSKLCAGEQTNTVRDYILKAANDALVVPLDARSSDEFLSQLDWNPAIVERDEANPTKLNVKRYKQPKPPKPPPVLWPKWYWEATKPRPNIAPGSLEITVRSRIAPLLLRLSWLGWPLFYSREHGFTFRVPSQADFKSRTAPLSFYDGADESLAKMALEGGFNFYKLPHKDGDQANVASPLGKSFVKYAQDGTLKSPGDEAEEALQMNALCSYWISARDRVMNQLVIWQNENRTLGLPDATSRGNDKRYGIIIPQVIPMGTVTRRAIEKTWLTASNAKKNRVGSELKAMVRAPEGYAIVGADVDSEELWISSCMGDAQFGLHGASAIGWMTLEGTKAAGTDLHSKTAKILGISRDQAKVFNYSRIYGAGMRHAVLLLLQSNPNMLPEEAQKLAENLYASTKGKNTHRTDIFERKFWFGGTESYLFNKLEEIALSDKPQTPALGCGVTYALSKEYLPEGFGADYMPSRINWVVQSSGVDYLHMLIVSMSHLIEKYSINARYLISVHDELRYLVTEEDKYRAALALQIANLWTRSMFAYKLGMDDLPQGVAFFSAVDVDHVLRKEVDMPCVTPSQPIPIPPGESLNITQVLEKTNGGSLYKNGQPMPPPTPGGPYQGTLDGYLSPNCLSHRAKSAAFLKAQASTDFGEVKGLAQLEYGRPFEGGNQKPKRPRRTAKKAPIGNGDGFDWSDAIERYGLLSS
ncbi:hypothetical protein CVT24_012553 [Panaeolus cyanescens]|uniref:Mitochondrial DNA polymerase catalytic subunit n=1 Tax=Panaeolus cyanescens TaxID=181874 RepID=A0A409WUF6_9AGAR|nr:hypothetical protein CVT24_012553 [Panaeolus cyanescens]